MTVRIARVDGSGYSPVGGDQAYWLRTYPQLDQLIRQHLPSITASLLARPKSEPDSRVVEWYSELEGQPVPLASLAPNEQSEVRRRLTDRLSSLSRLANNLPRIDPTSADLAQALKQALNYPGDLTVYVLGGQPVITYWGHIDPNAVAPDRIALPIAPEDPGKKPTFAPSGIRSRLTPFRIILATLALLGITVWFLLAIVVPRMFDGARGDCARLRSWEHTFGGRLASLFGLAQIQEDLDAGLYRCMANDLRADFRQRLAAADGDCAKLAQLERPLTEKVRAVPELDRIEAELNTRLQACAKRALIAGFRQQLADAQGDCPKLKSLESPLAEKSRTVVELAPLRAELSAALQECEKQALIAGFRQQLVAALGNCEELRALRAALSAKSQSVPELLTLKIKLDEALKPCIENDLVASFERRLTAAEGNCGRMKALQQPLTRKSRTIPVLLTLKNRLDTSLRRCEATRLLADFEKHFAAAQGDCRRLEALKRPLSEKSRSMPELKSLSNRLDSALHACTKKRIAKVTEPPHETKITAPPAAAANPSRDPAQLCPGERPKELAPEFVLVFDASGSMDKSIARDDRSERILERLVRGLPVFGDAFRAMERIRRPELKRRRIDAAKQAAGNVIAELPSDVDIGLVVLRDCPAATKVGFYPPAQRGRLQGQIASIHPRGGTPLANAVGKAGEMVDGVDRQALMVVISDGQESCGANPCAVGRRISRAKPKLKINVVDILGTGAGTCLAQATGGRVFTAQNANEIKMMLERAASDVKVPAHCRR